MARFTIRSKKTEPLYSNSRRPRANVRLLSNTFIPALVGYGGDSRGLGVSLTGLSFADDKGEPRPIPLDDERLKEGLHAGEGRDSVAWRWTTGELVLSPNFWDGFSGHVALHVTCNNKNATRRWIAPVKARTEVPSEKSSRPQLHVA
jgi:hypothetical protein